MLKLHLIDSLSTCYYSHLCNKYSENRTDGAYALVYRSYIVNHQDPLVAFFVAFHIFVVSKHRDFIFGVQVDGS